MSAPPACTLCGGDVGEVGRLPAWMSQFRAIFAFDYTSASAFLSGLGRRLPDDNLISVRSSEAQESDVMVHFMCCCFGRSTLAAPPETAPSAWAFPFHCSCWELLKASSPTGDVHIQSLFNLCRSFPIPLARALDFGHDYGGLYQRRFPGRYPPFPGEETQLGYKKPEAESTVFLSHKFDPLDASFLVRIAEDHEPSQDLVTSPNRVYEIATTDDPLGKLPLEILHYILLYLSSADVLNFKLSSRIIVNIPLPDRFWHSRFCHGGEFDYIFEFAQHSRHKGKWKKIFLSAGRLQNHPSLVNRKRIWGMATALHNIIPRMGTCHGSALNSWFERDAPSDSKTWVTASRNLRPYMELFSTGSRSLHERFIALPKGLSSISVSVADSLTGCYVAGTRVRDIHGNHWDLGYFQPCGSITFATMRIIGFLLAEDIRGVRGIRVLGGSGLASEWIGEHQNIPLRRLVVGKTVETDETPVKYIKGGFDGCKMVSLAITGQAGSARSSDGINRTVCLQDAAIWFPEIPRSEFSFFGVPEQHTSPLHMEIFSDFTGSHLPHVTGIKLWNCQHGPLISLQVDLDEPLCGQTKVYLGAKETALELIQRDQALEEHSFSISSADGERIIGLDTNYLCNGSFLGFVVHTNFDRAAQLPPDHTRNIRRDSWSSVHLWPEAGQIVGFYGTASSRCPLADLGIVCGGITTLKQFPSDEPDKPNMRRVMTGISTSLSAPPSHDYMVS